MPGVAWLGAMTPGLAAGSEAFGQRTGAHLADGGELTAKVCVLAFQRRNLFIGHDRVLVLTVHPLTDCRPIKPCPIPRNESPHFPDVHPGAGALWVKGPAGQIDHLFLGSADEVAGARRGGEAAERLLGAEGVRIEQAPEEVVGRVLAHVRCGGQRQEMARAPAQSGETALGRGAAGQRLGKLVAARLAGALALPRSGQLVRLVEDREIVGGDPGAPQPVEHRVAGEGVERNDDHVAVRSLERVAARASAPVTMRNRSPKSVRSSRSQLPTRPAGGTTPRVVGEQEAGATDRFPTGVP